jgi:CRP-like cAMP-binding protein
MTILSHPTLPHLEHLGGALNFVDEIHEVINPMALFEDFTLQEHGILCEHMECFAAPKGVTILQEGLEGDFLVLILTGQVSVVKTTASGGQEVVTHVGPGGFLGEMSLIDGKHRFASCITTTPTDFAVLSREDLTNILAAYPHTGNKLLMLLLQIVTHRLRDSTTRMLPVQSPDWV